MIDCFADAERTEHQGTRSDTDDVSVSILSLRSDSDVDLISSKESTLFEIGDGHNLSENLLFAGKFTSLINSNLGFLFRNVEKPKDNSKWLTIFLMLNTMIGSGILNQPQVFMNAGIIGAFLMFFITSLFVWLGLVVLVDCGIRHSIKDYSALCNLAFGKSGEVIVDLFIVMNAFGCLMSYITVVGSTSSDLVFNWGCQHNVFCGIYLFTCFMVFCFVLPLCLLQHYGHLGILSIISIFAITCVVLLVIVGGPLLNVNGTILLLGVRGMFMKIGSVVFSFTCASATFHAYEAMRHRSLTIWKDVCFWSVLLSTGMCCIMGLAGYLSFKQQTSGEILDNFPGSYADVFKVLLVLHLCLYIPVDFLVMRHSVIRLFGSETGILPIFKHTILTVSLLAVTTFLVLLLSYAGLAQGAAFGLILDFTGGIAGSCISFVMPAAMFLKLSSKDHQLFVPSICMFCFGSFVMVTVPVVTIINFIES